MIMLLNAFVIIHIRLQNLRFAGLPARTFASMMLCVLIMIATYFVLIAGLGIEENGYWPFIESAIYLSAVIYVTFLWVMAWTKANRMLNKAYGYESKKVKTEQKS